MAPVTRALSVSRKMGRDSNLLVISSFRTKIPYKMLNINGVDFLLVEQPRVLFFKILDPIQLPNFFINFHILMIF